MSAKYPLKYGERPLFIMAKSKQVKLMKDLHQKLQYETNHQKCVLKMKNEELLRLRDDLLSTKVKGHVDTSVVADRERELQGEISRLKEHVAQVDHLVEKTQEEKEALEKKLFDSLAKVEEAGKMTNTYLSKMSRAQEECSSTEKCLQNTQQKLQNTLKALENGHSELLKLRQKSQSELEECKKKNQSEVEELIQKKESEIEALRRSNQSELDELRSHNQSVVEDLELKLKETIEAAEKDKLSLSAELDEQKSQTEELKTTLDNQKHETGVQSEMREQLQTELNAVKAILEVEKFEKSHQTELTMLSMVETGVQVQPTVDVKEVQVEVPQDTSFCQTIDPAICSSNTQTDRQDTAVTATQTDLVQGWSQDRNSNTQRDLVQGLSEDDQPVVDSYNAIGQVVVNERHPHHSQVQVLESLVIRETLPHNVDVQALKSQEQMSDEHSEINDRKIYDSQNKRCHETEMYDRVDTNKAGTVAVSLMVENVGNNNSNNNGPTGGVASTNVDKGLDGVEVDKEGMFIPAGITVPQTSKHVLNDLPVAIDPEEFSVELTQDDTKATEADTSLNSNESMVIDEDVGELRPAERKPKSFTFSKQTSSTLSGSKYNDGSLDGRWQVEDVQVPASNQLKHKLSSARRVSEVFDNFDLTKEKFEYSAVKLVDECTSTKQMKLSDKSDEKENSDGNGTMKQIKLLDKYDWKQDNGRSRLGSYSTENSDPQLMDMNVSSLSTGTSNRINHIESNRTIEQADLESTNCATENASIDQIEENTMPGRLNSDTEEIDIHAEQMGNSYMKTTGTMSSLSDTDRNKTPGKGREMVTSVKRQGHKFNLTMPPLFGVANTGSTMSLGKGKQSGRSKDVQLSNGRSYGQAVPGNHAVTPSPSSGPSHSTTPSSSGPHHATTPSPSSAPSLEFLQKYRDIVAKVKPQMDKVKKTKLIEHVQLDKTDASKHIDTRKVPVVRVSPRASMSGGILKGLAGKDNKTKQVTWREGVQVREYSSGGQ